MSKALTISKVIVSTMHFFFNLFIYLFIFGCVGSSLLRTGFL